MQQQSSLKFNDIPVGSWIFGLIFLGIGTFFYNLQGFSGNTFIFGVVGLALLLLSWRLTITADRETRILRLRYWPLFLLHTTKEIPFDDIQSIRINSTRSGSRTNSNTRSYRIEVIRKDGSITPFRTTYTSGGSFRKQKIVDELRTFIGLSGSFDESPVGIMRATGQFVAAAAKDTQQALTGPNEQERVTNGVHWQLHSGSMGTSPVTRWFSPDFKMQDGFIFLAQKAAGQTSSGLMASLGKAMLPQLVSMYGFKSNDMPDLAQADEVASLPPLVGYHFTAFTSNQSEARQVLNPWVQNPLAEWGQKYPLKQFQSKGSFAQLILLFNTNGVTLATLGILHPEEVDEITALGVELVKAQGV